MDLVTCKECRCNMVPWTDTSETCKSCKNSMRQQREGRCSACRLARVSRPGKVCFSCTLGKAMKESAKARPKKKGWLWPLF